VRCRSISQARQRATDTQNPTEFFKKGAAVKIGLVGAGRMGQAIVLRLLEKKHSVQVWNRTSDKTVALVAAGATLAASPAELARASDVIICILTHADAQKAVYEAPNTGLLSADLKGKCVIDMSTVQPESMRRLESAVTLKGAVFVESPVGGTTGPAREGKLFAFVGATAEAFKIAEPVLLEFCRRIEHVGAVGAGSSLKLAVNLPLLVFWQSFGEALSLVSHLKLSPERLIDILSDTPGATGALKARAAQFVARLQGGEPFAASFNLQSIRKDLQTMRTEAAGLGLLLPVVSGAINAYDETIAAGLGDSDSIEQSLFWQSKRAKSKQ
jgi:3-hydroxyisobutyrate dehydrogenase